MTNVSVFSVHVLKDTDLPLEVAAALGPDVQFVLKYVGEFHFKIYTCRYKMLYTVYRVSTFDPILTGDLEIKSEV